MATKTKRAKCVESCDCVIVKELYINFDLPTIMLNLNNRKSQSVNC